jgi:hypothetical protein
MENNMKVSFLLKRKRTLQGKLLQPLYNFYGNSFKLFHPKLASSTLCQQDNYNLDPCSLSFSAPRDTNSPYKWTKILSSSLIKASGVA